MRLASQRVSGKVSNMTITKRVMGSARNAPGPPSSHAQKIKDKKTMVGEMLSPRPIIIGESTFSDRKSTRLNSSHANISYAVFCLKKKIPKLLSVQSAHAVFY